MSRQRGLNWDKVNRQERCRHPSSEQLRRPDRTEEPSTPAQRKYIIGLRIDLDLDPRDPPVPRLFGEAHDEIERLLDLRYPDRVR